jgi:hypothetical protein
MAFAGLHLEVDPVQRFYAGKGFGDVSKFQKGSTHRDPENGS